MAAMQIRQCLISLTDAQKSSYEGQKTLFFESLRECHLEFQILIELIKPRFPGFMVDITEQSYKEVLSSFKDVFVNNSEKALQSSQTKIKHLIDTLQEVLKQTSTYQLQNDPLEITNEPRSPLIYRVSTLLKSSGDETINQPSDICIFQNWIYFTDTENHVIRAIQGQSHILIAGIPGRSGHKDARADRAEFFYPMGITVDPTNGDLYVSDTFNCCIRKISNGLVTTIAGHPKRRGNRDGIGKLANFDKPCGLCINDSDLYICDTYNNAIRVVHTESLIVSTIIMNGSGDNDGTSNHCKIHYPYDLDYYDGDLYIADSSNHKIKRFSTNYLETLCGSIQGDRDGSSEEAQFCDPWGLKVFNGLIYVCDTWNHKLKVVDMQGNCSTIAGSTQGYHDSGGLSCQFFNPQGIDINEFGIIYVADRTNNSIRTLSRLT
eukprot:TRINITY_DN2365_c0_g1_i1.p2 TRINITY_DN2365_c0_g1~~TRINITY_DN2365_c0_g1_i1.p2  ORF type:complete len:434 (+),score=66.14 TRINITY_DN2365_c0_g1_i1:1541-2842(+)